MSPAGERSPIGFFEIGEQGQLTQIACQQVEPQLGLLPGILPTLTGAGPWWLAALVWVFGSSSQSSMFFTSEFFVSQPAWLGGGTCLVLPPEKRP